MNVFLFEMKNNRKFTFLWTFGILFLITITIIFYPMIEKDMDSFIKMMESYPPALKNAFGMNFEGANSILGYYVAFPVTFLSICLSLEAMLMGLNVMVKEDNSKTSDFLFSKPITRLNIFISKLIASKLLLVLFDLFLFIIFYILLSIYSSIDLYKYLLISIGLIVTQMLFLSIGIFIANVSKKVKSPVAYGMAVVLGLYAFNSFIDEDFRILIPFRYIKSDYILRNNTFEWNYFILSIALILVLLVSSLVIYKRKDIKSL